MITPETSSAYTDFCAQRAFWTPLTALQGRQGAQIADASPGAPSLSISNKCNMTETEAVARINRLTGGHKRTAEKLFQMVKWVCEDYGIGRILFLTLTFSEHVVCLAEAQRRWHSLCAGVLDERYLHYIAVDERQKSRRIHFHVVVVLKAGDVRTGVDFAGIKRGDYRSASTQLRSEWRFWLETAKLYGFGRTEALPVKSTAEGLGRYVGKYISKGIGNRADADKGARLVRWHGFKHYGRKMTTAFMALTEGAWIWRHKVKQSALDNGIIDYSQIAERFGRRRAFMCQQEILAVNIGHLCFPVALAGTTGAGPEVAQTPVNTGDCHVLALPVTMGQNLENGGSGGARTRNLCRDRAAL